MRKLILIILLLITGNAFAQIWPVKQLVDDKKAAGITFEKVPAFQFTGNRQLAQRGTYQELQIDASFRQRLMAQRPQAIQIRIPLSSNQSFTCELVKASLGNIKFTENDGENVIPNIKIPVLYRGIVTGETGKNNVILTVTDRYVSLVATFTNRAIQIVQADTATPAIYRLYNSNSIQFPAVEFNCGTNETAGSQSAKGIPLDGSATHRTSAVQDKCVNVYVDCFDSLYQWQGSSQQQTLNYVYELFNLVTTGMLNDSINIQIITINIWTTTDPYRQDVRDNALKDLANYRKDNFWGNICVGLDWGSPPRFGKASGFGLAKATTPNSCGVFNSDDSTGAFAYCDQNYGGSYQNFPTGPRTTQGQVYQVMHEIGHLLGAHHTHWCGWLLSTNPNVYGAIDNCASVEGTYSPGPPPPASGGTIMSYCNAAPGFINYNNGFGTIPGNTIRNFVSSNTCISNCSLCLGSMLMPLPVSWPAVTIPLKAGF